MKYGFLRGFAAVSLLLVLAYASAQVKTSGPAEGHAADIGKDEIPGAWARKMLDSLSLDEKIGQLFMIAAYSNKSEPHYAQIEKLVKDYHIGGLIFMQGGPGRQVNLINRYNKAARVPLLIAQDSEWGLSMRLDSTIRYPRNMTLGAIQDSMLIFEMGMEVGRQCRKVGVQVNFAPVVDVNNNPGNPVINDRSFGENPKNVAQKGIYMYKGMEYAGAIGCAKHFPGHGDTDTDSHHDLPVIKHNRARLDSIELYPFQELFRAGVPSVMVAHLYIPELDDTPNLASTLSPKIVTDLMRNEMGFKGLAFTDALGMKGVAKFWGEGEVDLKAFLAGNDVLLFSGNVPKAVEMIKKAVNEGEVTMKELNKRVLKILIAKEWCDLHETPKVPHVVQDELNTPDAVVLKKRLYQSSLTVPLNRDDLLPLTNLGSKKIACVEIGSADQVFSQTLKKYTEVSAYTLPSSAETAEVTRLTAKLNDFNTVIVAVDDMSKYLGRGFGIKSSTKTLLKNLNTEDKKVILVLFGSPYALRYFGDEDAVMVAFENAEESKIAAAEGIFGAIPVNGKLPVSASDLFQEGMGVDNKAINRLEFGIPEAAGMDGKVLQRIDSIARDAVTMGATPGCAVLVARGNKIVYSKGFGTTEYGGGQAIDPATTLYDLASVTKVAATTLTVMKLTSEGKIDPEESVAAYLSDFRGRNLSHIKVKNLLVHNAGFKSWIPFYRATFDGEDAKQLDKTIYSNVPDSTFCVPVVDGLYMCQQYKDTIWAKIIDSKVKTDSRVRYSDLSMIVMNKIIEAVTGTTLDKYVDSVFYKPMGMNNTSFNPAICQPGKLCAPTEVDDYWRHKTVQGYVHDQAAAMLGGVSGHAGLFSNVYDLAKIMYMVKNGGKYGEMEYFTPEIVERFTEKQLESSRKALGWDRPEPIASDHSPCGQYVSPRTYGHTGFTGIGVWVDPEWDVIYIFLSNRTFPKATNKKLIYENIRPKIQDVIYESIFAYEDRQTM